MSPRFNPPPGWPLPAGFVPPAGWQPDPSWPAMPPDWPLWVADDSTPGWSAYADQSPHPYQVYGQAARPLKPAFNGFAIASFVLGLLGVAAITLVLSVVFGIIALTQISARRERGKGLAIAGLALSGAWAVVLALLIAASIGTQANRSPSGAITSKGQVSIFSLHVGDCFQSPSASRVAQGITEVTGTPCTTPHDAQVFAQFDATDASYPGAKALAKESATGCRARIATSLDKSKLTATMRAEYYYPQSLPWAEGKRTISCLVVDSTRDLTTSLLRTG